MIFEALDEIVSKCAVRIDRPCGSVHPRHAGVVYPLDYGHLLDSVAVDGEGVDVFRGSAHGAGVVGVYLTVDLEKRDVEAKVLVDCTANEVAQAGKFLSETLHLSPSLIARS